jgi:hypothetical protein
MLRRSQSIAQTTPRIVMSRERALSKQRRLGGLALAVGNLVDDATVEIENIHRNLGMRKPITRAILDGAQQIAVPAFVSTLSICIVFVPVLLLSGAAKYLFTPLAMAVVFAMLTSYLHYLLKGEAEMYQQGEEAVRTMKARQSQPRDGGDIRGLYRRIPGPDVCGGPRFLSIRRLRADAPARAHARMHPH